MMNVRQELDALIQSTLALQTTSGDANLIWTCPLL